MFVAAYYIVSIVCVLVGLRLLVLVAFAAWMDYLDARVDALHEALDVHGSGHDEAAASGYKYEWMETQTELEFRLNQVVSLRNLFMIFNNKYPIWFNLNSTDSWQPRANQVKTL